MGLIATHSCSCESSGSNVPVCACGTLLTHAESIELFKDLHTKMTPELKAPSVPMPFNGFSQDDYRQKLIDEYKAAHVNPRKVYVQTFNLDDVRLLD